LTAKYLYATRHQQPDLEIYANNPILTPGHAGLWDTGELGTMSMLMVGELFHLYYEAWGVRGDSHWGASDYNSLQIGRATSPDGYHWSKDPANPVLPKGKGDDWDRNGTWDPFVLYEDGVFKMRYGDGNEICDWGYAESTDC
jgi:hypothetical protein